MWIFARTFLFSLLTAPQIRIKPVFPRRSCGEAGLATLLFAAVSSRNAIKRDPPPTASINPHFVVYRARGCRCHCNSEGAPDAKRAKSWRSSARARLAFAHLHLTEKSRRHKTSMRYENSRREKSIASANLHLDNVDAAMIFFPFFFFSSARTLFSLLFPLSLGSW